METPALIKFKIIESKGHSTHEKPVTEALEYINTYLQKNGGWFYINGQVTKIETVTEDVLKNASVVSITNLILGG